MIVLHCSGVMPNVHQNIRVLGDYHRKKGWKCVGYHEYVRRDGTVQHGRPIWEAGAHVVGHNKYSIGICYEGGLDSNGKAADTRTPEQVRTLRQLVEHYHAYFSNAVILGHNDLNPDKPCPCFPAATEYSDLQP